MSAPVSTLPPKKVEDFRRAVQRASCQDLRNNVDHYLDQMDQARARGDLPALAWARMRWNLVWAELDRRDGIAGQVA
jgi:hypothetical protein